MGDARRHRPERGQLLVLVEHLALALQLRLDALALGDVGDERDGHAAVGRRHVAEADLDRELGAILAPACEIQADSHRADARLGEVPRSMCDMTAPDPFRQEDLERLAEQRAARVAEHPLGGRVDQRDAAGRVDQDDALGGGFENRLGGVFAAAQRGFRQPRVVLELPFGPLMLGGARLQLGHTAAQPIELGAQRRLRVRSVGHGPTIAQDARLVSRRLRCRTPRRPAQRSDPR